MGKTTRLVFISMLFMDFSMDAGATISSKPCYTIISSIAMG
jgi:hypothetical protein